jgi:hypothetical protein
MRFIVDIECENEAFEDDNLGYEVAGILNEVASDLELGILEIPQLHDTNGNRVGWAGFIDGSTGASYNALKDCLAQLLNEYEEGMECDPPDAVLRARRLLNRP